MHVGTCTDDPADAGRRFQNRRSRESYEANEFRLGFTTDSSGQAGVLTQKYWGIGKRQRATSVVIAMPGADGRAACVTVPFKRLADW